MRHAVIMAGGSGTRLWPLSRRIRPKQLLRLFPGGSLMQIARERLRPLFPPERIWIITSAAYLDQVAAELPDIPSQNLIGEPIGRDTANAIGLAANLVALRDPNATMAAFTADHLIEPIETFIGAIDTGLDAAERVPTALVTFGIVPDRPHTGYGYVHRGEAIAPGTFRVTAFKEKPDSATAEAYFRGGVHFWNSGMFAWRTATILAELDRLLPENATTLRRLAADWHTQAAAAWHHDTFASLKKISIDFAVMEKAREVLVVEMPCHWRDIGAWDAVAETRSPDAAGNVTIGDAVLLDAARNNLVVTENEHLIVAVGVSDLIIVHSADATFICRRDELDKLKPLVEQRRARFGEKYE